MKAVIDAARALVAKSKETNALGAEIEALETALADGPEAPATGKGKVKGKGRGDN